VFADYGSSNVVAVRLVVVCRLSHAARAAGRDKVIIRIDCTDDDFIVLRMQQWTVCLLVVCGLSHAARAAGRDKVIIMIDFGDDDCFVLRVLCIYVCLNVLCAVGAVSI